MHEPIHISDAITTIWIKYKYSRLKRNEGTNKLNLERITKQSGVDLVKP